MAKSRERDPRPCERCGAERDTLYRVRTEPEEAWRLVCGPCVRLLEGDPGYRYGGTWKAKKRH